MALYYVNKNAQSNGDHEVHKEGCDLLNEVVYKRYLGNFASCHDAVIKAKEYYPQCNGCFYCSRECYVTQEIRSFSNFK